MLFALWKKLAFVSCVKASTSLCQMEFASSPFLNPVNAFTMGGIARDAGLSVEQFRNFFEDGPSGATVAA
jgi:hypothetical protein